MHRSKYIFADHRWLVGALRLVSLLGHYQSNLSIPSLIHAYGTRKRTVFDAVGIKHWNISAASSCLRVGFG